MDVGVAVLAGGQSRRMGFDKAGAPLAGRSLLEHVVQAARDAGLPVLVVGRPRPPDWTLNPVVFLPDDLPGRGPLGGLCTALEHTRGNILLVACDMPRLTGDGLRWLARAGRAQGREHGLAVFRAERCEPLFSFYTPACLPLARQALAEGRGSLQDLIARGCFAALPAPEWLLPLLTNVNTPDDLARLA